MSRKPVRSTQEAVVVIDSDDEQQDGGLGSRRTNTSSKGTPEEFPAFEFNFDLNTKPKQDFYTWLRDQPVGAAGEGSKKSLDRLRTSLFGEDADADGQPVPKFGASMDTMTSKQGGVPGSSRSSAGLLSPISAGTKAAAASGRRPNLKAMPKIAPVGGLNFSPLQRRAEAMARWGGSDTQRQMGVKRQKYEMAENEYLVRELCNSIMERKKFDVQKAAKDLSRTDNSIRGHVRDDEVMRALSAVVGMRAAPALDLFDARGLAAALEKGLDVREHAKIYVGFFKCACGGDIRYSKTTDANKKKYGFTNDYWIHCSHYFSSTKACSAKFNIKQLVAAVETAQLDSCRE